MASRYNTAGADSGVYDQLDSAVMEVWSQEIRFAAQPLLRFESVAKIKTDLQATPGSKLKFLRYNALTGPSPIAETTSIETETLSTGYREMGTTEHAKALAVRELLLHQAMVDVMADFSTSLGQHYAITRDMNIRDAVYWGGVPDLSELALGSEAATQPSIAGTKTIYGNNLTNRAALAGTSSANSLFSMDAVRVAVEYLATNKVPKFGGDAYICFVHPHQGIQIRQSSGWISVVQYADPTRIFNGEIGRIEDVRFIETTQVQVIKAKADDGGHDEAEFWTDNTAEYFTRTLTAANKKRLSTGSGDSDIPDWMESISADNMPSYDTYRAIILGEGAIGVAEVLPVEMRDNGVQDFGRTRSIGYYAIYGTGIIEETFGAVIETN
jgi:N4-gp56 family major capsid protein